MVIAPLVLVLAVLVLGVLVPAVLALVWIAPGGPHTGVSR
ncbi:hypothetical protein ABIB25_000683 [Nakamurella sp. UYEF19]